MTTPIKPDNRLATATAAKSGSTVTANVDGTVVTVQVSRDLTVASGDVIFVSRFGSQWVALGRMFASAVGVADDNDVPPDPKPSVVTGTRVISPKETRSYRSGGWRTDNDNVYQGQYGGNGNHIGAVFYGGTPRSLDGATVTSATIRVRRPNSGGAYAAQATTLRLMTESTKPAGSPTLTSSTSGPSLRRGETETFTIPDSWAQALVDGTAGGLAVYEADGSPYVILSGRGDYGPAFTLTINWTRAT
jgi:hypothetical protein